MKRPWLIKAGGELLADAAVRARIVRDLVRLKRTTPIVFLHGGGPQIEAELKRNNVAMRFENGRRVTSPEAMIHVERVLSGEINKGFAAELAARGARAVGLSCRDARTIVGKPIPGLERAARPVRVSGDLVLSLVKGGFLPVLSSVGADQTGGAVNINADDAASALAVAINAAHLVFLTNIAGVLDADKKTIPVLKTGGIDELINGGVISGGMIPKTQSARAAIQKGVGEVDIVDGRAGIRLSAGTRIVP